MAEFFKKFGQGLLYVLCLPVFLVALAGYAVYGVILFIVVGIKTIIDFFKGKSFDMDLPEDKEAKKRLSYLSNPFEEIEKAQNKEPIVVMEGGSVEPQIIEQQSEYQEISHQEEVNQIENTNVPYLDQKEEVIEDDSSYEEEDEYIPENNNEEDEILPMDEEEDDHIFNDEKDWWNR